jgi:acyl dehydratase
MERFYEDLQVGEDYESPARTITEADIVNFSAI